jgi:hypothetical protein
MKITAVLMVLLASTIFSALSVEKPPTHASPRYLESRVAPANDESLESQIVAKEREGLDALKNHDLERFGALTADEAVMVDAQGPASKAQVLKNVAGFNLTDYSIDAVKFVPISATAGLISYKITEKGSSHGKEFTAQAYVSSLWAQRGSNWVCLFSQETGVPRPPAPAAAQ